MFSNLNKPQYKYSMFLCLIYLDNEYILYSFHHVLIVEDDLNHCQLVEVANKKSLRKIKLRIILLQ